MKKILLIILIIFLLICIEARYIEPNLLLVRTEKIYVPNWDKKLDGYKIGVVADLHVGTHFVDLKKLEEITQKINEKNPDLVVILGDTDAKSITAAKYSSNDISSILKKFKASNGVIAIMGNHDYQPENVIRPIYKQAGIPLLEHQEKFVHSNGKTIRVVGFKDLWHNKSVPINVIGTRHKNIPTIVLAHNPDSFADMPEFVSLTLSGHTHGGETVFPIVGSFDVPSKYGQRFRKGYIIENNKHLYVSGGVATLSRLRFLNPPEITILELYSQSDRTTVKDTKPLKGINKNYAPLVMPYVKEFYAKWNK